MSKTQRFAVSLTAGFALMLIGSVVLAAADCPPDVGAQATADWSRYAALVLAADGRVRDTGNGDISHSEGQGFGMRLAFHYNQREDFARIWHWTRTHLYVRGDHLAAWRWRPDATPPIDDQNNATDGDLFIAWSLALAGRCWDEPDYTESARRIADDIRAKLVRETSAGSLLMPGAQGFEHGQTLTLNLSYWVFPAFAELARLQPEAKAWPALMQSGETLLTELRFGRWQLPPDWATWSPENGFALSDRFPPRFGYDAVRVPLYWIWQGQDAHALEALASYWGAQRRWPWAPDWVDLKTDAISSNAAPLGIAAIAALTGFTAAESSGGIRLLRLAPLSAEPDGSLDYYSASLRLFAGLAGQAWCRHQSQEGAVPCLDVCGDGD
ncbi:glycosyl hydrolase family 8 [Halochromatium sp.]